MYCRFNLAQKKQSEDKQLFPKNGEVTGARQIGPPPVQSGSQGREAFILARSDQCGAEAEEDISEQRVSVQSAATPKDG